MKTSQKRNMKISAKALEYQQPDPMSQLKAYTKNPELNHLVSMKTKYDIDSMQNITKKISNKKSLNNAKKYPHYHEILRYLRIVVF